MDLKSLLIKMAEMKASDLYLSTGAPASVKLHGKLTPLDDVPFQKEQVKVLAYQIMTPDQIAQFEKSFEMNLAISESGIGRFRVNIFCQRGEVSMVIRCIQTEIPTLDSLGVPPILKEVIMEKRGLVLFVGATGSGKSTTLAALINHRNENSAGHIVTIEDPIEFIHKHKQSIVNQREVGMDTLSYEEALKNTLRQSPDVILIGEIRSRETMDHAIAFAETGHLCLSTLHANNSNQAFDRIINFFPDDRKNQLLLDLSFNIKAIISQRLIPTLDGKRALAMEILLGTPLILSLINRGEIDAIKEVMEKSTNLGMQTFDQALEKLYLDGKISFEEAMRNADSKNNLRLKIKLTDKSIPDSPGDDNQIKVPPVLQQPAAAKSPAVFKTEEDKKSSSGGLSLMDD